MKPIILLVFIIVISLVFNAECDGSGSSVNDCKKRTVTKSTDHCCYSSSSYTYMGVKESEKGCVEVPKNEYENIKKYIDTAISVIEAFGGKDVKLSVDCSSSYLILSILGLVIFLL